MLGVHWTELLEPVIANLHTPLPTPLRLVMRTHPHPLPPSPDPSPSTEGISWRLCAYFEYTRALGALVLPSARSHTPLLTLSRRSTGAWGWGGGIVVAVVRDSGCDGGHHDGAGPAGPVCTGVYVHRRRK